MIPRSIQFPERKSFFLFGPRGTGKTTLLRSAYPDAPVLDLHVHIFRDGRLVVKWDLEKHMAIEGRANRRVRKWIRILEAEGRL